MTEQKDQRTPVRRADGRVVGHHDGETFYRVLRPGHVLHKPPAIAQDTDVLRQLADDGVTAVQFDVPSQGVTYSAPLSVFWSRGSELDRGHGPQRFVLLADFYTTSTAQPTLTGVDWRETFSHGGTQ